MFSIRVTGPDGRSTTYPFPGTQVSIGRDRGNHIVLEGSAVSAQHCMLELTGTTCTLKERGSTNGTWLNNRRLEEPTIITEQDRIYVGPYLLQLTRVAPQPDIDVPARARLAPSGPILRRTGPERRWREEHDRLQRYAREWDAHDRPARLLLRASELEDVRRWLSLADQGHLPEVTRLQRELIDASERAARARTLRTALLGSIGAVVLSGGIGATLFLVRPWETSPEPEAMPSSPSQEEDASDEEALGVVEVEQRDTAGDDPDAIVAVIREEIEHQVIPHETLDEIARRYGVSVADVAEWNLLNPDAPDIEGKILSIKRPKKRPLPQQKITYEVEKGENWTKLSRRFDIPVTKLRVYNPDVERLEEGTEITVWIDPKPYAPRLPRKPIPEFHIDKTALSVGSPNNGRLENGIQMPESDSYILRAPWIMWGSSYTIANLQKAVATFRQDVDFDGEIVLADISKKGGGPFPPHKSHQAGRDIDIWLPTLRGVYKKKYLDNGGERERKPYPHEADWYATWGLVRALIGTGAVKYVFLQWDLQEKVYSAAENMGATEEELEWVQWPRSPRSSRGILRNADGHTRHIHVRFHCAPWERECKESVFSGD